MARSLPDFVFKLTELDIERIIAEIVDNSLDKQAKKIHVEFLETGERKNDVGFAVYDNGTGFESISKLFESLEIEMKDKSRTDDEIGKYHIGMKILNQ